MQFDRAVVQIFHALEKKVWNVLRFFNTTFLIEKKRFCPVLWKFAMGENGYL